MRVCVFEHRAGLVWAYLRIGSTSRAGRRREREFRQAALNRRHVRGPVRSTWRSRGQATPSSPSDGQKRAQSSKSCGELACHVVGLPLLGPGPGALGRVDHEHCDHPSSSASMGLSKGKIQTGRYELFPDSRSVRHRLPRLAAAASMGASPGRNGSVAPWSSLLLSRL